MTITKIACALFAAALLTGCDQSSKGKDAQAEAGERAADAPGAAPPPSRAEAQQARDFIVSRLDKMDLNRVVEDDNSIGSKNLAWTPSAVSLLGDAWSWTEETQELFVDASGLADTRTEEHFRVAAKLLAYPVTVKQASHSAGTYWTVTMECASSDCFAVNGKKTITTQLTFSEAGKSEQTTSPQRQSNSWWFSDENTARRVAHALDVLLRSEGAQKQIF